MIGLTASFDQTAIGKIQCPYLTAGKMPEIMNVHFVAAIIEGLNESSDDTTIKIGNLILANNDLVGSWIEHSRRHGSIAVFTAEMPREINWTVVISERLDKRFNQWVGFHGFHHILFAFDFSR